MRKVGDIVRRISDPYNVQAYRIGELGVITKIEGGQIWVRGAEGGSNNSLFVAQHEEAWELVTLAFPEILQVGMVFKVINHSGFIGDEELEITKVTPLWVTYKYTSPEWSHINPLTRSSKEFTAKKLQLISVPDTPNFIDIEDETPTVHYSRMCGTNGFEDDWVECGRYSKGTTNATLVTCGNCKRTKEYKNALLR